MIAFQCETSLPEASEAKKRGQWKEHYWEDRWFYFSGSEFPTGWGVSVLASTALLTPFLLSQRAHPCSLQPQAPGQLTGSFLLPVCLFHRDPTHKQRHRVAELCPVLLSPFPSLKTFSSTDFAFQGKFWAFGWFSKCFIRCVLSLCAFFFLNNNSSCFPHPALASLLPFLSSLSSSCLCVGSWTHLCIC